MSLRRDKMIPHVCMVVVVTHRLKLIELYYRDTPLQENRFESSSIEVSKAMYIDFNANWQPNLM